MINISGFLFLILSAGFTHCVYIGCYKDDASSRILPSSKSQHVAMDIGDCIGHCINGDYKYAGLEYGNECWCGSTLGNHNEIASSNCQTLCEGNHDQICGGSWAISIYSTDFVGCYKDYAQKRVFPDNRLTTSSMTTDICVDDCKANGYKFAGTENGNECWCGNSVYHDQKTGTADCNKNCAGDPSYLCGGNFYISVYTTASSGANRVSIGKIPSSSGLHMVSGLAASRLHPGYLYAVNDNAGNSKIFIINTKDASIAGVLTVQHSQESDWEDIAVGKCPHSSGTCIFVTDSGGSHPKNTIYSVKEPATVNTQNVQVESTYKYDWNQGSSEAVMVDNSGNLYLLSESKEKPAKIAKLPNSGWNSGHVIHLTTSVTLPDGINKPLGADISPDGKHILIKTLYRIYHWYIHDNSPTNALKMPGFHLPYAFEHEGEAVAWKQDGTGYYTIGQGSDQFLHFYKFKDHPHGAQLPTRPTQAPPTQQVQHTTAKPSPQSTEPFHNPAIGYYNEFVEIGHISGGGLHITSGLAASRQHPGYLYAINDNSDSSQIYMVDEWTAEVVATLHVQHATQVDWEDIAVGSCGFYKFCIYVADTGATGHKAENVVYKISEPEKIKNQNVQVAGSIHFSWSEASSEALVADAHDNVYLMSDGSASKLARLPNGSWGHSNNVHHLTSILTLPLDPSENGPLAADISPNGQELLVKTLHHVYHWHMTDGDVARALTHKGNLVSYHPESRGEAVTWNSDGSGYYTFGQGSSDSMYLFRHRPDVVCNWCPKH